MRRMAETGKDSPLVHTAAAALVVGYNVASSRCSCCLCRPHCGCDCGAAYCMPEGAAQIRPADGFPVSYTHLTLPTIYSV